MKFIERYKLLKTNIMNKLEDKIIEALHDNEFFYDKFLADHKPSAKALMRGIVEFTQQNTLTLDSVKDSLNCWIATRINGASASMGCSGHYVDSEIVKLLDEILRGEIITLDSKIKDGEPVEEPINRNELNESAPHRAYLKALEEYQNLPTIGECLKELEGKDDLTTMNVNLIELNDKKYKQIEQLKKERDSDRKKWKSAIDTAFDYEKQLQAEKQKVKEAYKKGYEEGAQAAANDILNQ
jgi:hypothetical protein